MTDFLTSRRGVLMMAAGAAASPLLTRAGELAAPAAAQVAGWARFPIGGFTVTMVSDGNLVLPADTLAVDLPPEELTAFLESRHRDPETRFSHTNHAVIDAGEARVLVDVGSGDRFQPSAGRLTENLAAAGIALDSITHVVLTHAHPDHVWGMMDDFGDEPRIPAPNYAMGAQEFDWWTAEGRVEQVPEAMQAFVVGARNALLPMAERIRMVEDGAEIVPGVRIIATPGHTPGHMSVMVESEGEAMLVAGDALTHAYVSFERPEWRFAFDMDAEQAAATRRRLLDRVATEGVALSAYHLPFPGVGHAVRDGEAWRFLPALMKWSG
jgi:glyoxylase-like metal-dependent hydrolase (beta-lactamase superfamily II)